LPRLWNLRRGFSSQRKMSTSQFRMLLNQHHMTAREIAEQ